MNENVESEARDDLLKYYRLEIINHIGYIISTLIACGGLLHMKTFLQFADTYKISVPIVIGVVLTLITYFISKTWYLLSFIYNIRARYNEKLFSLE